jgi:radical SAM family uncharacterized protein/radical SAM-linked protein
MLRETLERRFFPFVEKPARYIGGEMGVTVKPPDGLVNFVLAYPDLYEVGMSYVGGQMLYHLINSRPDALCERVYTPAPDASERLRRTQLPLFALESLRPLREFDIFGVTLSYEMVFTNLLEMLELAGIPYMAAERSDADPLVIAGGPVCYNPEPMADFIDAYFIGEVEDALDELIGAIRDGKGLPRRERLLKLAQVESVYVPSFYDSTTRAPLLPGLPARITARHTEQLKADFFPSRPLLPPIETAHDRIAVEIMRGCPQACRFCQAGKVYKPVRVRPVADIKRQILANLKATGYDEVSLLSLSTTDYPAIDELILALAPQLDAKKVALSLPSLRPASFTAQVADAVKRGHKTGLTFAPEVGTERMRRVIRKEITDDELLTAVRIAFEKGWQVVKLYFMVGLPTETTEDLQGIVDLIMKTVRVGREIRGQHQINVSVSPFSPKAHTPFQWDKLCSPDEINEKQEYLRQTLHARDVTIKFRNPHLSYLEGVLGRGDRTLGKVILSAYKRGAHLDGWGEYFRPELWYAAFADHNLDPASYARDLSFSEPLPWDHIDRGQTKESLFQERSKTSEAAHRSERLPMTTPPTALAADDDMYGRRKKKIAAPAAVVSPIRGKIRIKWGKQGLARFLSHLENNRVFERALRRCEFPVAYSQGFHPHQKMSFGPPLPHGYSSDCEYLDIQLDGTCTKDHVEALSKTLPNGFSLFDYKMIYSKAPAISTLVNRAVYRILGEFGDIDMAEARLGALCQRGSLVIDRATKDGTKPVEIRPAIYGLRMNRDNHAAAIEMELGLAQGGYARPNEILEALDLFDSETIASFHFHRQELYCLDDAGNRHDPLSAVI